MHSENDSPRGTIHGAYCLAMIRTETLVWVSFHIIIHTIVGVPSLKESCILCDKLLNMFLCGNGNIDCVKGSQHLAARCIV